MNDMDFYREMIAEYLKNDKRTAMEDYFAQEDWENYRIIVHALKSTSLTIGAADLSEQAKKLEMAAKSGDVDYIRAHHGAMLEEYTILYNKLAIQNLS